jgi:hypothetical protein
MRNSAHWNRAAVAALASVFLGTSASAACLKDNTDGQIAEGVLTVQRAEDLAGRPERPFILRLKGDACLDTKDPEDAVKATRTIQVYPFDEKDLPSFKRLVGQAVKVSGNPFAAHTAHHHAPIVMRVQTIERLAKR